jgi:hypothetical protein
MEIDPKCGVAPCGYEPASSPLLKVAGHLMTLRGRAPEGRCEWMAAKWSVVAGEIAAVEVGDPRWQYRSAGIMSGTVGLEHRSLGSSKRRAWSPGVGSARTQVRPREDSQGEQEETGEGTKKAAGHARRRVRNGTGKAQSFIE